MFLGQESKLKAARMHLYVRRGGPNYQAGLAKMRTLGEALGLPIEVGSGVIFWKPFVIEICMLLSPHLWLMAESFAIFFILNMSISFGEGGGGGEGKDEAHIL